MIAEDGNEISFAHRSFKWANLASQNAGVTVVIVGLTRDRTKPKHVFDGDQVQMVTEIGPYLTAGSTQTIEPR